MAEAISLANLRVWEDALQDLAVGDLSKKSAELVAIAHERGAPDNVTLCFLAVEGVA
jgi:serine/threonine protein phosphatase PrpC